MSPEIITWIYVALAALDLAWGLFLMALNYRSVAAHRAELPGALAGTVTVDEAGKASAYSLAKMRLSFLEEPVTTIVTVAAAASGLFGLLDGAICALVPGQLWRGVLFMASVGALSALLSAPFSLYGTFGLEKRFGFNTTTLGTWLLDALKGAILSAAIGLPLLALLFWFMDATGGLWWLWAAAIFSVVDLVISLLYPLAIAPLFNRFTPLEEGSLAGRIRAMADRLGFRMGGIFVMDGSRRSSHGNAYFTGLGRNKRIVFFDTLLSRLTPPQVEAVLAHELGHFFVGRRYKMAVSPPYFIPLPIVLLGTLGAVILMLAPPKNRRQLLQMGAAGPLAGLVFAIPLLIYGLSRSSVGPLPAGPFILEGNSIFYGGLKYLLFGQWLPGNGLDVNLNNIAFAAWAGVLITALNLIPAGQFDGGHAAFTLFGQRIRPLTWVLIGLLAGLAVLTQYWGWLLWAGMLFMFGQVYATPMDDLTPLDGKHKALAVLMLVLFVLLFTPIPIRMMGG